MIVGKKIFITGGGGFLATHLAERLAPRNHLTLLSTRFTGAFRHSQVLPSYRDRIQCIEADVRDIESVRKAMRGCHIVLHCASLSGVANVKQHARTTIDTIVGGTKVLLDAACDETQLERVINVSTSEVYGDTSGAHEGVLASISTSNDPRVSYAVAKLLAEHYVWAYRRDFSLPVITLRPFNVYGPMRTASHAVGAFIVKAVRGETLSISGDGSQVRSWCYIDDFIDGAMACLESDAAIGEDINLGNALTATTIYDLAMRIVRLTGSSSLVKTSPSSGIDMAVRIPFTQKAHRLLGFSPRYNLDAGLAPTIAWYRERLTDFAHWR